MTGETLKVLEEFHHQDSIQITGMTATCGVGGECEYPLVESMDSSGLHPIREYSRRRQETIAVKVSCRLIYEICAKADRMPGTSRMMR